MSKEPSLQELQAKFEFYNEIVSIVATAKKAYEVYYQYDSALKLGFKVVSQIKADAFTYLYFYHFQHVLTKILAYLDTDTATFHKRILVRNAIVYYVDLRQLENFFAFNLERVHEEWKKAKGSTMMGIEETFDDLIKEYLFIYRIIYNNYSTMNFLDPRTELIVLALFNHCLKRRKEQDEKEMLSNQSQKMINI